jgi:hypothetical protein
MARTHRRKTGKRRGGFMNRIASITQGTKVRTFCCDSKTSDGSIMGKKNVGSNCTATSSGQCNAGYGVGQNYKFRCFDVKSDSNYRDKIAEENSEEKCEYVPGSVSRVMTAPAAVLKGVASTAGQGINLALMPGGRRRIRGRHSKKHSRGRGRRSTRRRH